MGYEGVYEVSNLGRIRSLGRTILRTDGVRQTYSDRLLTPQPVGSGHLKVTLCNVTERRVAYVHHLVLEAFVGPRPEGMEARHYPDPDPTNNRAENLQWGTHYENMQDKVEHGTVYQLGWDKCPKGHEYTPENTRMVTVRRRGKTTTHRQCRECRRVTVSAYKNRQSGTS